jgi:putative selenate reductase molybdopterin-binding subunit
VRLALSADGRFDLAVGTAEFGNGTSTVHQQIAASVLGTLPSHIRLRQSDTDAVDHDTGAYGSTGTVVAGTATLRAAEALRTLMLERGAALLAVPAPGVTLTLDGAVAGHPPDRADRVGVVAGEWTLRRHAALGLVQRARILRGGAAKDQ